MARTHVTALPEYLIPGDPMGRHRQVEVFYNRNLPSRGAVLSVTLIKRRDDGTFTWQSGQRGDFFRLLIPMDRVKPSIMRALGEHMKANVAAIHALLDRHLGGDDTLLGSRFLAALVPLVVPESIQSALDSQLAELLSEAPAA